MTRTQFGSPKHVVMLRMLSLPRDSIRLDIITTGTGLPAIYIGANDNRIAPISALYFCA